ncbi:hypothetical protein C0Q44_27825 [Paenibacillus sp. PCH8]|nr:hypothetical protein C0Q44_27825 [Paenibacillus sp. PCH8]
MIHLLNTYEQLEKSIRATSNGIIEKYQDNMIDTFQCMEQLHTCCTMVGTLIDNERKSGSDKELIIRLIKLRDDISQPVMQMVYDQIQSLNTKKNKVKKEIYKLEVRKNLLSAAAG